MPDTPPTTPPETMTDQAIASDLDRIRDRLASVADLDDDPDTLIAFERITRHLAWLDRTIRDRDMQDAKRIAGATVEGFAAALPILDRLFPGMHFANEIAVREAQKLHEQHRKDNAQRMALDRMLLQALDRLGSIPTTAKAYASRSGRRDASTSAARDGSKKTAKKGARRR